MAKVLVVGGGGREHALAWALARAPEVKRVVVAPGNAGTRWPAGEGLAEAVRRRVAATDLEGQVRLARDEGVDLVVVGPEAPLAAGLADRLAAAGIPVFGPSAAAARLEASKAFAKALMQEAGVPTAEGRAFTEEGAARDYLKAHPLPVVVKASGLAAGKGVLVAEDRSQAEAFLRALFAGRFGEAGKTVVIERFLEGPELSVFAVTDGERVRLLPPARDYKRADDGGKGPNTGGMGACSPPADATADLLTEVKERILLPTLAALKARGTPFIGVLYAGLKLTPEGPRVLEFNVRLGDPEAQAVLPRLEGVFPLFASAAAGRLSKEATRETPETALTVVLASGGYPGAYETGYPIRGLAEAAAMEGVHLFFAGAEEENGQIVTAGGRVLAVTGLGADLAEARARAYSAAERIDFEKKHYRRDIGEGCG